VTPILSGALLRTQSDARLLALVADGHERAFEAIVERYRRPLHRFCRRVLPESRAEDAVQQTFLKAWSALSAGTQVEELRAWLYRIARNAALDAARKAGYDYDELTDSLRLAPGADEDLERRAVIRETLTGVAALPANQREALLRTAVDGHSRAAIARDLDVSEGAVRQLVHRARTALRAAATVLTPLPFASWAAAFGGAPGGASTAERIGDLAAGAGSAGGASLALKAGTVMVAAGVLAVGPPGTALRNAVRDDAKPGKAEAATPGHGDGHGNGYGHREGHGRNGVGHGHDAGGHRSRGSAQTGGRRENRAGGGEAGRNGSDVLLGSMLSGSGLSGSGSGDHHSGSGSSGSGSSGSGSGDHSGSGTSGSGTSGSGSGSSGSGSSGSGDSTTTTTTNSSEGPGPGGTTTMSSSGDSGSGSSGPGSGDTMTTSSSGPG
jgi:RNA polymerase sigma factor (sigma-70 family)